MNAHNASFIWMLVAVLAGGSSAPLEGLAGGGGPWTNTVTGPPQIVVSRAVTVSPVPAVRIATSRQYTIGVALPPRQAASSSVTVNYCLSDTDGNLIIDIDDIIHVILDFGTNGIGFGSDVDLSGTVDVDDLVQVILDWGPCLDS